MDDFEDIMRIVLVVVLVAAAAISQWLKPLTKAMAEGNDSAEEADAKEVTFGGIRPVDETEPLEEETRPLVAMTRKHRLRQSEAVQSPTPPAQPETIQSKAEEAPVRIRTKADARKAFLYSEIFNRKYE
jgi:hypothetical protein